METVHELPDGFTVPCQTVVGARLVYDALDPWAVPVGAREAECGLVAVAFRARRARCVFHWLNDTDAPDPRAVHLPQVVT